MMEHDWSVPGGIDGPNAVSGGGTIADIFIGTFNIRNHGFLHVSLLSGVLYVRDSVFLVIFLCVYTSDRIICFVVCIPS